MGETPMPLSTADTSAEPSLLCPACGYDLRASNEGRCPECGLAIDHAVLRVSAFPWAHRRDIGRVWAYVKTVWHVTAGSHALAHEASKPQSLGDARSFRRVTAALVFASILAPLLAAAADNGGLGFMAIPAGNPTPPAKPIPGVALDLIIPWAAGITFWPVLLLCLVLVAFHLTGAQGHLFHLKSFPPAHRERAAAIALYASAPLSLLALAVTLLWGVAILAEMLRDRSMPVSETQVLVFFSLLVAFVAVAATFVRVGQWFARVRHGGLLTGVAGAVGLLGAWLLGFVVLLGLLPWCLGFLWLVFDSLR